MKSKKIDSLWSHVHWLGMLATMGSFTAAAERLGVSKAAMSHRIGELESAAAIPLVRRTTRSVRLTEAGQQLVDSTREAFSSIERSFAGVRDMAEQPSGLVRVTVPVALGRQQIVPLLPAFLKSNPLVQIDLELSDRLSSLPSEGFDLAIRHAESAPDTHVAWSLCETHTVLAAAAAYLRQAGSPQSPADLANHNCLSYRRGAGTPTWSFEPFRGKSGRINVAIRGNFVSNNSETLRELALAGSGIAMLPDFSAMQALETGRLIRVLPQWRPVGAFGGHVYAIRPYSPHVPRAIQALVTYLRDSLKTGFVRRPGTG